MYLYLWTNLVPCSTKYWMYYWREIGLIYAECWRSSTDCPIMWTVHCGGMQQLLDIFYEFGLSNNVHAYCILIGHSAKYGNRFNELRIRIAHERLCLLLCVPKQFRRTINPRGAGGGGGGYLEPSFGFLAISLTGTGHFASFHGTGGGGLVGTTPLALSPLIELELPEKNEHVARRETKRLIYKFKVLGQPVTSEVRSSAEKWRKPVIADNFASDRARAKFQHPPCSLRQIKHVTMVFECPQIIFRGQKFEKSFSGHMTSLTFDDPVVPWPRFKSS